MKHNLPGRLIVFEGIDGIGKSTQLTLLGDCLRQRGYDVVLTREPTSGPFGQQIRDLYRNRRQVSHREELELFLADRREHVHNLLLPALAEGRIILCDRYFLSTVAYQGAHGFDPAEILARNDFAPDPDLALLFEVSLATSLKRITLSRGDQLNDFEQAESLTLVNMIFQAMELPYIVRVNGERTVAEIHREVVAAIHPVLPQPVLERVAEP